LILIDIGMPDTIRLQVVDKLKTADLLPRCKLVALCNKNSIDEVGRASQKGFTGVLLKPFQGEEARTLINNILQTQTQFACRKGDIFVLHYPTKDEVVLFSVFRQLLQGWQQWLGHLAAGGHTKVVIDIAQAATIGIDDLRFFRELAGKASELGIGIVFVVGEPKSFELRHFWESGVARSTATLEEAKKFFQQ
jgi:CheY-like chemotaxis protein